MIRMSKRERDCRVMSSTGWPIGCGSDGDAGCRRCWPIAGNYLDIGFFSWVGVVSNVCDMLSAVSIPTVVSGVWLPASRGDAEFLKAMTFVLDRRLAQQKRPLSLRAVRRVMFSRAFLEALAEAGSCGAICVWLGALWLEGPASSSPWCEWWMHREAAPASFDFYYTHDNREFSFVVVWWFCSGWAGGMKSGRG